MLTKERILQNEVTLGPDPNPFDVFFKSRLSIHIQIRSSFITKCGGVEGGWGWEYPIKIGSESSSLHLSLKLLSSDINDNIHAERHFASK